MTKKIVPLKDRLYRKCSQQGTCIVWNGAKNLRGYGVINIGKRKEGNLLVHRASWLINKGSHPKNLILHTCDVRNCINIDHLKEGTPQDNTDDMMRKKRYRMPTHYSGSKNGNSMLTEELVIKIKSFFKEGKGAAEISKIMQQPYSRIYDIKRKRTWAYL
jgi:hypothetical protein